VNEEFNRFSAVNGMSNQINRKDGNSNPNNTSDQGNQMN